MIDTYATGLQMGESPRWHDGELWVCDWLAGEVLVFDAAGNRRVVTQVQGLPFSIDWLPDGRLVVATADGVVTGVDLTPYGATGHPWNELVVDTAGRCWIDMPGSMPGAEPRPGIVAVVDPDGSWRRVADDVWFPNGMAIVDDDTLVVAESHADRLTAWTITAAGDLVDRRAWAQLDAGAAPDGICVDASGAIWYASVPGQRCVRVAPGGDVLEVVDADRGCFSCVLGGEDGRTLFVVANAWGAGGASDGVVCSTRVDVLGAGTR